MSALRIHEARRRARYVGAIVGAWEDGRRRALARRPRYPEQPERFTGELAGWWLRGYRHGMRERPSLEQLSLFGGGGACYPSGGAASAVSHKPGRAAKEAPAAPLPGARA